MGLSFLCKTVTLHFRQIFCVMKCFSKILFTDFTIAEVVPSLYTQYQYSEKSHRSRVETTLSFEKWGLYWCYYCVKLSETHTTERPIFLICEHSFYSY